MTLSRDQFQKLETNPHDNAHSLLQMQILLPVHVWSIMVIKVVIRIISLPVQVTMVYGPTAMGT